MRARHTHLPAVAALLLLGATATGCGISGTGPVHAGAPASGIRQPGTEAHYARLYFAGPYGIRATNRPADRPVTPQQALDLLLAGPTSAERDRGLVSQVPDRFGAFRATTEPGAVDVHLPVSVASLDVTAISQIVCTAAHADVPGGRPATEVDIRIHENVAASGVWTVRCGPNDTALPVTGSRDDNA